MSIPLISVVVPVFNVEQYLTECIESILRQSFRNFELLLVNDGSTDNSEVICKRYEKLDDRVKVFSKKNGGLADARNFAIDRVTGKYITFIDSDDYVLEDYLLTLLKLIKKDGVKISQVGMFSEENEISNELSIYEKKMSCTEAFKQILHFKEYKVYACGKLYANDLFESIRYPYGKLMEDSFTTYKYTLLSNYVNITNRKLYFYRQRSGSIMNSSFNSKKMELLKVPNLMREYLSISQNVKFNDDINYYTVRLCIDLLNQVIVSDDDNKAFFENDILNVLRRIKLKKLNIKYFILTLWVKISFSSYKCFVRKFKG